MYGHHPGGGRAEESLRRNHLNNLRTFNRMYRRGRGGPPRSRSAQPINRYPRIVRDTPPPTHTPTPSISAPEENRKEYRPRSSKAATRRACRAQRQRKREQHRDKMGLCASAGSHGPPTSNKAGKGRRAAQSVAICRELAAWPTSKLRTAPA